MRGKGLWTVSKSPADRITPAHAGKSTRWLQSCRRRWDHPRACGEKFLSLVILLLRMGSPPRMRGKGARHMVTASARRITPAYAGKRPLFQVACSVLEDHPRVCGEKDQVTPGRGSLPGSPPRMRGKASNGGQQGPDARITPAYAGKSRAGEGGILCRGDHPRVCGEKWSLASWSVVFPGSPPRMRGKVALIVVGIAAVGITPAYAGKSGPSPLFFVLLQDHPRVCGEKHFLQDPCPTIIGSPPRMRGKAVSANSAMRACRITPAYAGKSAVQLAGQRETQDHPRVCGEKPSTKPPTQRRAGSPPRMRGKDRGAARPRRIPGITPAYAGKSAVQLAGQRETQDHPRVCGEKPSTKPPTQRRAGSPPRMRGKDRGAARPRRIPGITPAYAGKSADYYAVYDGDKDHPRVCGEKVKTDKVKRFYWGSPPRMRGKATLYHPLGGGAGSPPRMRGKVVHETGIDKGSRITPAYAGKRGHE